MTKKRYIYEFIDSSEKEAAVGLVEVPNDADEQHVCIELGDSIANEMGIDADEMRVYDIDQDALPNEYALGGWKNLEQYEGVVVHGEVIEVSHA